MKIELIKRKSPSGDIFYHVRVDDRAIISSVTMDLEKAEKAYQDAIQNKGEAKEEILNTTEI